MFNLALLCLLLPVMVSAHGYVWQVTIDGKVYSGNPPGSSSTTPSIIRTISSNSPIKGATNQDLSCGSGAQPAAQGAQANPGSQLVINWGGGYTPGTKWPHNTGPIMTYMANCGGDCTQFQSTGAKWFKISELGLEQGDTIWYQSDIQAGLPTNVTIPSTLAPGSYLVRSEIISLQLAMTQGGAEFYPACFQITVGGSQTGGPTSSETVTFPGGYSDTDPGILTPNIYNPPITYTFPGPPVAAFVNGGSSAGSGGSSPAPSTPSGSVPGSGSPASSPSSSMSTPASYGGSTPAPAGAGASSPAYGGSSPTPTDGGASSPAYGGVTPTPTDGGTSSPAYGGVTPTPADTGYPSPSSAPSGSGSTCKRRKRSTPPATARDSVRRRFHRRRDGSVH